MIFLTQILTTYLNNFLFIFIGLLGTISIILSYVYLFIISCLGSVFGTAFEQVLQNVDYVICTPAYVAQSAIAPVSIGNHNSNYILNVSASSENKGLLITFGGNNMPLKGDRRSLEKHSAKIHRFYVETFNQPLDHLLFDIKQAKDYATLIKMYDEAISKAVEMKKYNHIIFHGLSMGGALALSMSEKYHSKYPHQKMAVSLENTFSSLSDVILAYDLFVPYVYYAVFWPMNNQAINQRLENSQNIFIYATGVHNDNVLRGKVFYNKHTKIFKGNHNDFRSLM